MRILCPQLVTSQALQVHLLTNPRFKKGEEFKANHNAQ